MVIVTRIRREVLTLPAARLGPDNPLPPLRPLDEVHRIDDRDREGMPHDMARQLGHAPCAACSRSACVTDTEETANSAPSTRW